MARNRSTTLIGIGVAVFVVGAALAFLGMRAGDDDGDDRQVAAEAQPASQQTPAQAGQPETAAPPALEIPDGKEAVAVQLPYVPGVAGHVKAGDHVNVYGTFKGQPGNIEPPPVAKLVLSNVPVLAVSAPAAGSDGGNATFLMALNAHEAEQVIFLSSFEGVWLSKVKDGAPPVGGTPGRNHENIL